MGPALPRILNIPAFSVSIVHKIHIEDSLATLRAPPAKFSGRVFVRECVCVCGWIVIWHGIVGVDLLCEANISLKAHFLNHCFTIWSFASNALFKRSRVCVPFRRHNIIYGHFPQS